MPDKSPNSNDQKAWIRSLGLFSVIVADLVICSGIGVGIGYWAWHHWNAPWWVVLLSSLLGLIVAFFRLYQVSQAEEKNENDADSSR